MLDHCERDISAAAFFFFKTYYPLRYITLELENYGNVPVVNHYVK